jgi:hypothetical protein
VAHFYELKTIRHKLNPSLGAEVARHLAMRQDLGTAVVVTNTPSVLISVVRKTWLRLTRQLQNQRAGTLNPEEILRLTHTIMHMQRMQFVTKSPAVCPDAQVYFVSPEQLKSMPPSCFTLYLCSNPGERIAEAIEAMPSNATVVNFDVGVSLSQLGLKPKSELEASVVKDWQNMVAMLKQRNISPRGLLPTNPLAAQTTDDALDTLLGHSHEFLLAASSLRYSIHLAQPITTIGAEQQQMFDAVMRLAHRVQSLMPKGFDNYLVRTFGDKNRDYFESYFLRDIASEQND